MRFQGKRRFLTGMESTAMADIIFLLLIFFLLSSSFILQTGIKIDQFAVEPETLARFRDRAVPGRA